MKIVIVDTYYPKFLSAYYKKTPGLERASYDLQLESLLSARFGTSDFYSHHLRDLGVHAEDLIVNCLPMQRMWAIRHALAFSDVALKVPHRFFRVPLLGSWLARLPGLVDVAFAQIQSMKPDVLYCQDLSFFPPEIIHKLKGTVQLVVGQIACPLPPENFLKSYDLILTSLPHFVPKFRDMGINSEYFRIGFESRILKELGSIEKNIDVSFVGGISRHHHQSIPMLEELACHTPIQFFGYGVENLDKSSPIRSRHNGEVWGLDMYRTLGRSRMTVNRHINIAGEEANNMRLYEATGMGALLITDRKKNLGELFEINKEVVAYSSKEEAVELINHFVKNPDEADKIAKAGQNKTIEVHGYGQRMMELIPILKKYI